MSNWRPARDRRIGRRNFLALSTLATAASAGCAGPKARTTERDDTPDRPEAKSSATVFGERKKWHRVGVTYEGPTTDETAARNPFLDYRMTVTFTAPSGRTFQVPGHYAADGNAADSGATGGGVWRAYLAPDEVGQWRYSTEFVVGPEAALEAGGTSTDFDGDAGRFEIDDADETGRDFRGRGRLDYVGEHYLQFQGSGDYYLKFGAGSPENFLAYHEFDGTRDLGGGGPDTSSGLHEYTPHVADWNPGDPTWQGGKGRGIVGAINYLSEVGVNAQYLLTYTADGGDGQDVWPWTDPTTKRRFDVSKLDQWEVVFGHMQERGVLLHCLVQETENDSAIGGNGDLNLERKLYLRELVSRFAHHPAVIWNLGEETTLSPDQLATHSRYVRSLDPYDHPVVVHTYPGRQERVYGGLLEEPSFEGPSIQTSGNDLASANGDVIRWRAESERAGRPWVCFLDEPGPHTCGVPPDGVTCPNGNDQDAARKSSLWGALMGGAAGHSSYFGYENDHDDLTLEDFRSREQWWEYNRIARRFFEEHVPTLAEMRPNNEALGGTDGYVLEDAGERHVVYLRSDVDDATLDLPEGNYRLRWFDPRNGTFEGESTTLSGGFGRDLGGAPPGIGDDSVAVVTAR